MATGPKAINFGDLAFQPRFAHGEQAEIAVVSGTGETSLGTGFARLKYAAIPWTVQYDEVMLVLDGHVTVETDAGALDAGPHDCIWLPKGTELRYIAEDALVFYAIHPANWAEETP